MTTTQMLAAAFDFALERGPVGLPMDTACVITGEPIVSGYHAMEKGRQLYTCEHQLFSVDLPYMKDETTTIDAGFKNLTDFHKRFPDEDSCREHLELVRWNGNIACTHCHATNIYRVDQGLRYKCGACRRRFTVKMGTIFEKSPLSLYTWFLALHIHTSRKKGVSSLQLANDVGVTQKTAWFMLGRLRHAIRTKSFELPLSGIVEADETYVGGKPRKKGEPGQRGRSTDKKTPVLAVIERGGELRSAPSVNVKGETIAAFLTAHVDRSAVLMTDQYVSYIPVGKMFASHESVNHAHEEYVRRGADGAPDVHTNTIEGAFSHFKRMILGTYHSISREHTHRYCAEHDFRYNTRKMKSPARFVRTLGMIEGRLTYKVLIANGTRAERIKREAEEARAREEWIDGLLPF